MRFKSYLAVGALALVPALALAASQAVVSQPGAQPMLVKLDNGQTVPVKAETRVIQTASGPMKVSTWSWHSPQGGSSFEMQTSTGGVPPATVMKQIQAMQYQMRAMQVNMMQMQQRMFDMQRAAFSGLATMPVPQNIGFDMPFWGVPDPVVVVPVQRALPPAVPAVPVSRGPEIKA